MTPLSQQQAARAERHFRSGQRQPAEGLLRQAIEREPTVARTCELATTDVAAYEAMWSRHGDGLAPDHLAIVEPPLSTTC